MSTENVSAEVDSNETRSGKQTEALEKDILTKFQINISCSAAFSSPFLLILFSSFRNYNYNAAKNAALLVKIFDHRDYTVNNIEIARISVKS